VAQPTFEELYAKLEETTRRLEEGNLPLEKAVALYEEGAALATSLREMLAAAELRMRTIDARFEEAESVLRESGVAYDAGDDAELGYDAGEDD
jgi:exodeoxyribonuclease VII small subunit